MGEIENFKIAYATEDDLANIATCHVQAFPKSVTSMLGKDVVRSMLKWYLSASNKFLFYIKKDNVVIGYCGGHIIDGRDNYGSSSGMTQFGMNTAAMAFLKKPWLLFHPEIRKKYKFIALNIKRKLGLAKSNNKPTIVKEQVHTHKELIAGLVVIGVNPSYQQKGIGTLLQQEFERKARTMGATKLSLSVRTANTQAIHSYKKNGYEIKSNDGTSYIMTKEL